MSVVFDGYFDGIYLVGPFVVGQDGFGRKFRFFGNPDYLAGIIPELCIAEIGKTVTSLPNFTDSNCEEVRYARRKMCSISAILNSGFPTVASSLGSAYFAKMVPLMGTVIWHFLIGLPLVPPGWRLMNFVLSGWQWYCPTKKVALPVVG